MPAQSVPDPTLLVFDAQAPWNSHYRLANGSEVLGGAQHVDLASLPTHGRSRVTRVAKSEFGTRLHTSARAAPKRLIGGRPVPIFAPDVLLPRFTVGPCYAVAGDCVVVTFETGEMTTYEVHYGLAASPGYGYGYDYPYPECQYAPGEQPLQLGGFPYGVYATEASQYPDYAVASGYDHVAQGTALGTVHRHEVCGLAPGSAYNFRVRVRDQGGRGPVDSANAVVLLPAAP